MREAQFNSEVVKSLKHWGAWAWKIPDMPVSMLQALRFSPDHPCDIVAAYQGRFLGIEGKMLKKYEAFGIRHLRPAQIRELDSMVDTGNDAYIFLNIRITAPRENKLIILPWKEWRDALHTASIKAEELRAWEGVPLTRVETSKTGKRGKALTKQIYDLRNFLQQVDEPKFDLYDSYSYLEGEL